MRYVLVAVAVVVLSGSAALAAGRLVESTPSDGAFVTAPTRIVLRFDGRINTHSSTVTLIGGPRKTKILLITPLASDRPDVLIYSLPQLESGRYRVEWKALSVDGHLTDGSLTFQVD